MQELSVNLTIPIPEDSILITKNEWNELKEEKLRGVYWDMKQLEERIHRKQDWIKENILYQPRFIKKLDAEKGGFVYYPRAKGQKWSFQANKMADFLDKHFSDIFIQ
ncbi:DUF771 domain-containing protein [Shouchella lonarensis]|uniref:Prophage pi2 protein 07 n=1 Tax=Shouchella lonarensis TaxID=1464122 RepID=A0A1G6HS01_9BACI|nr:DUF771 domain-containing protein [Shouchella lonarensis]SDB96981.1 Prophage pi2 protein 07 [Shouchella lonarensis]